MTLKNRFRAFLIHLMISLTIGLTIVFIVFFLWYPAPLHEAAGVTQIFLLLLFVDVVIGPILTLIVYAPNKLTLKFDLIVIAMLQLAALSYGINTVFEGRPGFIVFTNDRFVLGRVCDMDPASLEKALKNGNESAVAGWKQPRWVATTTPKDPKRAQEVLFSSLQGGPDIAQLPELFIPISQVKEQMLSRARPMQELRELAQKTQGMTLENRENAKWLPLAGKAKNLVVLIDSQTAKVVEILDIDPYALPSKPG